MWALNGLCTVFLLYLDNMSPRGSMCPGDILYCILLYCIVLCCVALRCVALHGMEWLSMEWHCMALYCIIIVYYIKRKISRSLEATWLNRKIFLSVWNSNRCGIVTPYDMSTLSGLLPDETNSFPEPMFTIQIKYGLPYCVTCPSMSTDPGSLNPGTRRSRVAGWWDPGIRTNTGAGDTVLAKHT